MKIHQRTCQFSWMKLQFCRGVYERFELSDSSARSVLNTVFIFTYLELAA